MDGPFGQHMATRRAWTMTVEVFGLLMLVGSTLSKAIRFGNVARLRIPQSYSSCRLRRPIPQFTARTYSNSSLKTMYPSIEPYFTGKLKVSDIHEL
jgi:hypothetical protein